MPSYSSEARNSFVFGTLVLDSSSSLLFSARSSRNVVFGLDGKTHRRDSPSLLQVFSNSRNAFFSCRCVGSSRVGSVWSLLGRVARFFFRICVFTLEFREHPVFGSLRSYLGRPSEAVDSYFPSRRSLRKIVLSCATCRSSGESAQASSTFSLFIRRQTITTNALLFCSASAKQRVEGCFFFIHTEEDYSAITRMLAM